VSNITFEEIRRFDRLLDRLRSEMGRIEVPKAGGILFTPLPSSDTRDHPAVATTEAEIALMSSVLGEAAMYLRLAANVADMAAVEAERLVEKRRAKAWHRKNW